MTADELLAGVEHTETKAEQAEKLILDLLADGKADVKRRHRQSGSPAWHFRPNSPNSKAEFRE